MIASLKLWMRRSCLVHAWTRARAVLGCAIMKALVFHRPHHVSVDTVPDPRIAKPTDAIVRVTSTAICGSDLHIYNGLFPQPKPLVMGHEFMGIVEEVGKDVRTIKRG